MTLLDTFIVSALAVLVGVAMALAAIGLTWYAVKTRHGILHALGIILAGLILYGRLAGKF